MSAAALLARVRALGVRVRLSGNNIALRPIAAVPEDLKAAIKAHKLELLALLREDEGPLDPFLASGRLPPAWVGTEHVPVPGSVCGCCRGTRWWSERDQPKGWRCYDCHPPAPGIAITELRTGGTR